MRKIDEVKLIALSYAEKNKRPLKAIEDYMAGYSTCVNDVEKIGLEGFKELCKIIINQRIKVVSNEFYDPNMGAGRRKEIEGNIESLKTILNSIINVKIK